MTHAQALTALERATAARETAHKHLDAAKDTGHAGIIRSAHRQLRSATIHAAVCRRRVERITASTRRAYVEDRTTR